MRWMWWHWRPPALFSRCRAPLGAGPYGTLRGGLRFTGRGGRMLRCGAACRRRFCAATSANLQPPRYYGTSFPSCNFLLLFNHVCFSLFLLCSFFFCFLCLMDGTLDFGFEVLHVLCISLLLGHYHSGCDGYGIGHRLKRAVLFAVKE